jgi:CubicO group peptidase (beta-lactamase class C family)
VTQGWSVLSPSCSVIIYGPRESEHQRERYVGFSHLLSFSLFSLSRVIPHASQYNPIYKFTLMSFTPAQIHANLAKCHPDIERIRKTSGAPGLAIGLIHQGTIIFEDYFGYRNLEAKLPVNRDTTFHVASLTKAMTAAAIGILVDRGALNWDTPVSDILPFYRNRESEKSTLNMQDFLSHRRGTRWGDALYLQSNNTILLPKSESLRTFDGLQSVHSPRTRYLYNNHAYNIPGFVIEQLSG